MIGETTTVGSAHAHGEAIPRVPVKVSQLTTRTAVLMAMYEGALAVILSYDASPTHSPGTQMHTNRLRWGETTRGDG
jgi:hypothetical protein